MTASRPGEETGLQRKPWMATAAGSVRAAWSGSAPCSNGCAFAAGTTTCSANPPGMSRPSRQRPAHRWMSPFVQREQVPHGTSGSMATERPAGSMPTISWPGRHGSGSAKPWGRISFGRSLPQMPTWLTRTTISPSRGCADLTSCRPRSPLRISHAFMRVRRGGRARARLCPGWGRTSRCRRRRARWRGHVDGPRRLPYPPRVRRSARCRPHHPRRAPDPMARPVRCRCGCRAVGGLTAPAVQLNTAAPTSAASEPPGQAATISGPASLRMPSRRRWVRNDVSAWTSDRAGTRRAAPRVHSSSATDPTAATGAWTTRTRCAARSASAGRVPSWRACQVSRK